MHQKLDWGVAQPRGIAHTLTTSYRAYTAFMAGKDYQEQGRPTRATEAFLAATAADPDWSTPVWSLFLMEARQVGPLAAQHWIDDFARRHPKDPNARYLPPVPVMHDGHY